MAREKDDSQVVLTDTSLCAIVRDEKMNPAGGIERFVYAHAPFVEEAVIADTGSIDGTRDILESLKERFRNLRVIDLPFEGYATTRNKALKYIQTKRVLILDADELLTSKIPQNDWKIINRNIEETPSEAYKFLFNVISPFYEDQICEAGHLVRLFDNSIKNPFQEELWERFKPGAGNSRFMNQVEIKHFIPSYSALRIKAKDWYLEDSDAQEDYSTEERLEYWKNAPSASPDYTLWKSYNSKRDCWV